jgi:hypothetical protein
MPPSQGGLLPDGTPSLPRLSPLAPSSVAADPIALPQTAPYGNSGSPPTTLAPRPPAPAISGPTISDFAPSATGVLGAFPSSPLEGGTPFAPPAPWASLADLSQAVLGSAASQASPVGAADTEARGGGPVPQAPEPAASSGSASAGGSGVAFSLLLALLFSIAAFALQHYSRLRLPQAQWRPFAFVAVIERPG